MEINPHPNGLIFETLMVQKHFIMADTTKNKQDKKDKTPDALKPDPETLHTTDPQKHMRGPVSSTMQNIKEEANKNDEVSKEEADRKKEENM